MSTPTPSENGSILPLRPALREMDSDVRSPKSGPAKVVSIAAEEEEIPPQPLSEEASRPKIFTASTAGKRLTGRPTMSSNSSSRVSLRSQGSVDELTMAESSHTEKKHHNHAVHPQLHSQAHPPHRHDKFVAQVTEWLQAERAKHAAKRSKKRGKESSSPTGEEGSNSRPSSRGSDSEAISLEKLQKILEDNMNGFGTEQLPDSSASSTPRRPSQSNRRRASSILSKLGGGHQSSDTEHQENDVVVPSCDVVLDNTKTMSYSGGTNDAADGAATPSSSKRADKEKKAWSSFKLEILKLAHTLKLKGWRGIPFDISDQVEVSRLSGALTNAVYVVSPPKKLPPQDTSNPSKHIHRKPDKLLLRIYGPQVEHLIDRENELGILRRLARKKIGPRLLGTFENGRFEEFFNAQTLTPKDLIDPDTSKQIAKRMRELHDGVDLLEKEREKGPFVWTNWDKWVKQCEQVTTYLDKEIKDGNSGEGEAWRSRGLICGVEWPLFKATVDKYRKWLNEDAYRSNGLKDRLVFAHNDTQYGNILRLIPEPKEGSASPLLMPGNSHKRLIVIDFEYASANTPGLEFANHFTEWCYNYHDEKRAWECNTEKYPSKEQQERFIRSYVNHRPQFNPQASATPRMNPADDTVSDSISNFYLERRTPGGSSAVSLKRSPEEEADAEREADTKKKVAELLNEVKIWRVANSAQWVAWGIVQAKLPQIENEKGEVVGEEAAAEVAEKKEEEGGVEGEGEGGKKEEQTEEEKKEAEFDYLAYAQDRAMFFWGDVVGLGLVEAGDLPEGLRGRLKVLER